MLGTLVFIAISIGVVCVVVLLANRKKGLLRRVLFWVGVSLAFLALVYTFLGSNSFEHYDSIKAVALGIVALTMLVASKVYDVVKE